MFPWSVMAMACMSIREHSLNRSFSRAAPSSIEYSVWTCRCTKESRLAAMKHRLLQACRHALPTGRVGTGCDGLDRGGCPAIIAGFGPLRVPDAPAAWPPGLRLSRQHVQRVLEIGRIAAGELDPPSVLRMSEPELYGVQPLPGQAQPGREHRVGA